MKNLKEINVYVNELDLTKEESMKKINEIKEWYAANGHLLEEEVVLIQEEEGFREAAAAMKGAIYGVESTGRRKFSGVKGEDDEQAIIVSNFNFGKSEWITSKYKDEKGKEVITYDDGGVVGSIVRSMSSEINYGRANEDGLHGRSSYVEDGFSGGTIVITDERGNYVGKGSLNDELAYRAKEDAMTRSLVKQLEARSERRSGRKELALKVMEELIVAIKDCDNYGRIKRIINVSHYILRRRLKAEFGNGYVTDYCKYIKDGKETNLNSWFLSYFSKKLWATVNESKWKAKQIVKNDEKLKAYEAVQKKLDKMKAICDNKFHMAEMLRSNHSAFGISPKETQAALNHASRVLKEQKKYSFSAPVFGALCEIANKAA